MPLQRPGTSMEGQFGVFFLQGSLTFACLVEWSVIDSPLYARFKPNTLGDDDCMTGARDNKSLGVDAESRDIDRSSVSGVVSVLASLAGKRQGGSAGDDLALGASCPALPRRQPACPHQAQLASTLGCIAQLASCPRTAMLSASS